MKRLLGLGLVCGCLLLCNHAQAVTVQQVNGSQGAVQYAGYSTHYIDEMGVKILNANKIDKHVIFGPGGVLNYSIWGVKDDVTDSNRTLFKNRKVVVSRELFSHASSDDEVAALISHEIAHCLKSYTGLFRGSFHGIVYTFTAKKQNYEADKTAVDLMAKAGYNPVGLITILDKTAGQYRFDIGENGLTTKRIRKINEYIKERYPQYISAYASNPFYKNAMMIIAPAEQEKNLKQATTKKDKV